MKQAGSVSHVEKSSFVFHIIMAAVLLMPLKGFAGQLFTDGETAVYKTTFDRKGKVRGWAEENSARYKPLQWTQKINITPGGILWRRSEQHADGGREEMTALIRENPQIRVISWTDTITTPSGSLESRLEADFSEDNQGMYPGLIIYFLLRSTDLQTEGAEHEARIWWGPKSFSRASWSVKGKERITVPAGTFECYVIKGKLLIEGKGLVYNLIQKILPGFYFYLSVEPPHYMVKFKMPNPNGDTVTDMLISYKPGK